MVEDQTVMHSDCRVLVLFLTVRTPTEPLLAHRRPPVRRRTEELADLAVTQLCIIQRGQHFAVTYELLARHTLPSWCS